MKVYVVTAGEYSSYHIEAIFTNETIANQYANLDSDRVVEEYEADVESINPDPNKLIYYVNYNFEQNKIVALNLTQTFNATDDYIYDFSPLNFIFYVNQSDTLNNSVRMFGSNSDWLLKIAQDRFYMYCDAHDTSRKELIRKKKERDEAFSSHYSMFKTSGDGLFNPYFKADMECNAILKDMIKDGIKLPTGEELRETYRHIVKKVEEEHDNNKA